MKLLNSLSGRRGAGSQTNTAGGGLTGKIPGMRPGSWIRNGAVGFVYLIVLFAIIGAAVPSAGTGSAAGAGSGAGVASSGGSASHSGAGAGPATSQVASDDLAIRISYSGDWSGAVGTAGSTQSVDGYGTQIIDVPDDADVVSANAQKRDDGYGTLTVQILRGNTVIAESSTSADYGVAQTSKSFY